MQQYTFAESRPELESALTASHPRACNAVNSAVEEVHCFAHTSAKQQCPCTLVSERATKDAREFHPPLQEIPSWQGRHLLWETLGH